MLGHRVGLKGVSHIRNTFLVFNLLIFNTSSSYAGCMEPFGEYISRAGKTTIKINIDQTVKVYFPNNEFGQPIFEGRFTNFDELKGTEFHNFANPVNVESKNKKQASLIFHIAEDCSLMKGGHKFRDVGEKIKIDDSLFLNTNQKYQKSD